MASWRKSLFLFGKHRLYTCLLDDRLTLIQQRPEKRFTTSQRVHSWCYSPILVQDSWSWSLGTTYCIHSCMLGKIKEMGSTWHGLTLSIGTSSFLCSQECCICCWIHLQTFRLSFPWCSSSDSILLGWRKYTNNVIAIVNWQHVYYRKRICLVVEMLLLSFVTWIDLLLWNICTQYLHWSHHLMNCFNSLFSNWFARIAKQTRPTRLVTIDMIHPIIDLHAVHRVLIFDVSQNCWLPPPIL